MQLCRRVTGAGGYLAGSHQSPRGLEGGKALGMDPSPDSRGLAMTMLIAHVDVGVRQMSFGKVRTDFELIFTAVISCLDGTVQSAKYLIFNTTSLTAFNCHKIHMPHKLITKEVSERCPIQKSCQTLNKAYKMLQLRIKVGHSVKNETAFTNLLKAFLSPKVG